MATTSKNFIKIIFSSVRLQVVAIMVFIAIAIYSVFLLLAMRSDQTQRVVTRLFYIADLKAVIADQYFASLPQNINNQEFRASIDDRFKRKLDKGTVFKYSTAYKDKLGRTASQELEELYILGLKSQRAEGKTEVLEAIYQESLEYPRYQTYVKSLKVMVSGIKNIPINKQIVLFTLIGSLLLGFIALQVTAVRIGKIASMAKKLILDNDTLDISQRIDFVSTDETGDVARTMNTFLERLEQFVSSANISMRKILYQTGKMFQASEGWKLETQVMRHSTDRISKQMNYQISGVNQAAAALEEMERTLDMIFNNISRQSAAMTESAATLEEMGRQVEGVANISSDTAGLATKLTEVANKGNQAVDASIISIRDVAEYSTQIIKLLKLITGIAKQTNLLAMNASIEAAHAGEAGRGFAIVAEEIRRLSETTNKNAKEIRTVVDTMVEKIENSVSQAQMAGEDLHQINSYAGDVEERIAQLNNMMQEQNTATHEMIVTIEGLVNLAQEIKLSMEEQQHGLHEYSNTIGTLKENFGETKSILDGHMSSVENLLLILTEAGIRINIKKKIMDQVLNFLEGFKFREELTLPEEVLEREQQELFLENKQSINK